MYERGIFKILQYISVSHAPHLLETMHRHNTIGSWLNKYIPLNLGLILYVLVFTVPQRGQAACSHQLRSWHWRAQGQGPGQPERGECMNIKTCKAERCQDEDKGMREGRQDRWEQGREKGHLMDEGRGEIREAADEDWSHLEGNGWKGRNGDN